MNIITRKSFYILYVFSCFIGLFHFPITDSADYQLAHIAAGDNSLSHLSQYLIYITNFRDSSLQKGP